MESDELLKKTKRRRSSIFFPQEQEVEVNINENFLKVEYPPDYLKLLQNEEKQWVETTVELKNSINRLTKELKESSKIPVDLSLLSKENRDFFKDVPEMYNRYLNSLSEFVDQVNVITVQQKSLSSCYQQIADSLNSNLERTDENIKEYLHTLLPKKT